MFGGVTTPSGDTNLLSDLTLDNVDFDWVKKTTKVSHLKKAIKLIEDDGKQFFLRPRQN